MRTFNYDRVKDPTYFNDNRVAAHSDHRYFTSVEAMEQDVDNFRYSLNGLWKFHYAKTTTVPFPDLKKRITAVNHGMISVCRLIFRWRDMMYHSMQCTVSMGRQRRSRTGSDSERFNPVASYVKYFEVPEEMEGKKVFISFQGAESGIAVWLNGNFVGYSEDTFTPSEFELTPYLKEGENKLAAQVQMDQQQLV